MELGNIIFGNSRGEFPITARKEFENVFIPFLEKIGVGDRGYDKPHIDETYATFDNEIFTIRPYYWGDKDEICELPNFVYKPTGLEINWYKYPLRDSYMSQDLTLEQLSEILDKCLQSVEVNNES